MTNSTTLEAIVSYRLSSYITAPVDYRRAARRSSSTTAFFTTFDAAIRSGSALLSQDDSGEGRGVGVGMNCYQSWDNVFVAALPQLCDRGDTGEDLSALMEQANTEAPTAFVPPASIEIGDGYADDAEDANVLDGFAGYQLEQATQRFNGRRIGSGLKAKRVGYFTPNCVSQQAIASAINITDGWRAMTGRARERSEREWLATRMIGAACHAATAPNSGSCVASTYRQRRLAACR